MKPLVIIPARGGSKGVPKKNIKPLLGKPLIFYTIEEALECFDNSRIVLSSDSEEIIELVKLRYPKINFRYRPAELASDTSGMREVILDVINYYRDSIEFDKVLLLQPTSPFRKSKHIKEAQALFSDSTEMVVSVKYTKASPFFNLFKEIDGLLSPFFNAIYKTRQEVPPVYEYNGAIYLFKVESILKKEIKEFKQVKAYKMTELSSVDIDTILDWNIAEMILEKKMLNE